jgi:hypothetical protein
VGRVKAGDHPQGARLPGLRREARGRVRLRRARRQEDHSGGAGAGATTSARLLLDRCVSDAFAHAKLIGYTEPVLRLVRNAAAGEAPHEGCVTLRNPDDGRRFLEHCQQLYWPSRYTDAGSARGTAVAC